MFRHETNNAVAKKLVMFLHLPDRKSERDE